MDTRQSTPHDEEAVDLLGRILTRLIKTPGYRRLLYRMLQQNMTAWAGERRHRRVLSRGADRLARAVLRPGAPPPDSAPLNADIGRLITVLARQRSEGNRRDPAVASRRLQATLTGLIRDLDFGELKELADTSPETWSASTEALSEVLWQNPAKVVSLLASTPSLANASVRGLQGIVGPVNEVVAPDLLADIVFSLLRSLDGRQMGVLVNQLAETLRRLHTGSGLLGKIGVPMFQADLTSVLSDAMDEADPQAVTRMKIALAEDAESVTAAFAEAFFQDPRWPLALIAATSAIHNPAIRARHNRLRAWEDLPQGELADACKKGFMDLDTQEIAEIINTAVRLLNQVHAEQPGLFADLMAGVSVALDSDELADAADWLVRDAITAFKPALLPLMPGLLEAVGEMLTPEPGQQSDELFVAMTRLRELGAQEVTQ